MFADPQVVTINTVANSMPRVMTGNLTSSYSLADRTLQLNISSQITNAGRVRHTVELVKKKIAADPVTAINDTVQTTYRFIIDREGYGFTVTDVQNDVAGLVAWLSSANVAKLYGTES